LDRNCTRRKKGKKKRLRSSHLGINRKDIVNEPLVSRT